MNKAPVLPNSKFRYKPAGWCQHPTCKSRAMSGAGQSTIRCEVHKDLCCRCWKRPYKPELGYCGFCHAALVRNVEKYHAKLTPAPPPKGNSDQELLRVLDEFMPDWERN